ncbi:unnamed protein product, partial [Ilex paraguariensis]
MFHRYSVEKVRSSALFHRKEMIRRQLFASPKNHAVENLNVTPSLRQGRSSQHRNIQRKREALQRKNGLNPSLRSAIASPANHVVQNLVQELSQTGYEMQMLNVDNSVTVSVCPSLPVQEDNVQFNTPLKCLLNRQSSPSSLDSTFWTDHNYVKQPSAGISLDDDQGLLKLSDSQSRGYDSENDLTKSSGSLGGYSPNSDIEVHSVVNRPEELIPS